MIRPYRTGDVPLLARLHAETEPERPIPTAAGLGHWLASHPERARFRAWVAEEAGEVVGYGYALFEWAVSSGDVGFLWLGVAERARERGLGHRLFEVAANHLVGSDARKLETHAAAASTGERFALARGFRRTRTELIQRLDLPAADVSALPALEAAARTEGFRIASLADVRAATGALHALYTAAEVDMPADDPEDDLRQEDFEHHVLGNPDLDRDASAVVLHGDRPVALSFLVVDRERGVGTSDLTGTLPELRRRGLARLAKLAVIRWAQEHGLRELLTENDAENAGMRALNASLGYRVSAEFTRLVREPAGTPSP